MDKHAPVFSVVVPIHNKEPHIVRALESVLTQEFQDFELILVDDASTDGSMRLVAQYSDQRMRILSRVEPGPGGYAARNLGIMEARGEYVAFLDADDEWYPKHLSSLLSLARQFPQDQFFGCGWMICEGKDIQEDPYYRAMAANGNHHISTEAYLRQVLSGKRPVHTSIACIRNNSFMRQGLFPAGLGARRGGDLHTWLVLVCTYRGMAWSSHVGGRYYKDTVNMVTKIASSSTDLLTREIYSTLAVRLSGYEKKLLKKYFNRRLRISWINNFNNGTKNFCLPTFLFWKGDMLHAFIFSLRTLIPRPIASIIKTRSKKRITT